jgi:hypothetical protein
VELKSQKGARFLSRLFGCVMAEGQGFEPWVGYKPTPVFKTGAFNHSATLPKLADYTEVFLTGKVSYAFFCIYKSIYISITITENH